MPLRGRHSRLIVSQIQIREELILSNRVLSPLVRCEPNGSHIEATLRARLPDIEFDLRCWATPARGGVYDVDGGAQVFAQLGRLLEHSAPGAYAQPIDTSLWAGLHGNLRATSSYHYGRI